LPAATYTLTATKIGYSFLPSSLQVTLPPNGTDINFTGTIGNMIYLPLLIY
jgi:hypothetical protein